VINYEVREYDRVIARGNHGIDIFWLNGLDQSVIPMLWHLLPYADTMFNSSQVRSLSEELDRLPQDNPLVPAIRDDLKRLCEHVSNGAHRQVWLLGD
jgi:hypothetical protein